MKKIIILIAVIITLLSCNNRSHRVKGNGAINKQHRTLNNFTKVETRGAIDVVIKKGDSDVEVEADENILQYIETKIENDKLVIAFKKDISIVDYEEATVYVTAPTLNELTTKGSGDISSTEKITGSNKMILHTDGSGDIELKVDCPEIETATYGSGDIILTGECKNLSTTISGSGDVKAVDLNAENVKVEIKGSGDMNLFASVLLDVNIAGSGDVHYLGEPKINSTIRGSGSVMQMND